MEKKSWIAIMLLVSMCVFTWHIGLAIEIVIFEAVAWRYLFPVINDLCAGKWSKDSFKEILLRDEELQFGFIVGTILYLMILGGIITWLITNFGIISALMAIVYIIMPALGIYRNYHNK